VVVNGRAPGDGQTPEYYGRGRSQGKKGGGFKPAPLQTGCKRLGEKWSGRLDSNQRPPCAQGKLGRPRKVLVPERFAVSENLWAQIWGQSGGDAELLTASNGNES